MSVATQLNISSIPFKLEYDEPVKDKLTIKMAPTELQVTPQDLSKSTEPPNGLTGQSPSFRYRGFPEESFEKSRHPIFQPDNPTDKLYEDFTDARHNRKQQFDKVNPKAFGKERNTFLFSSDQLPSNESKAKPITGALMEKSAAAPRESDSAQLRRFNENKSLAAQEIAGFKQKRIRELQYKQQEQQRDKTMLDSYNPWGQPGAGAPLGPDHKKKVFTETDLEVKGGFTPRPNAVAQDLVEEHGDFNSNFGRPGGGAALRSNSGKIKTEIKGAADIRFQNTPKGHMINDIEARYKPKDPSQHLQYSQSLETQILERRLREQNERKNQFNQDIEMMQHDDPFGKPGAGAPNATNSGTSLAVRRTKFDKSMHGPLFKPKKQHPAIKRCKDTDIKALHQARSSEIDGYQFNPWGKGQGNPDYNEHGDVRGYNRTEHHKGGVHTRLTPLPDPVDPNYGILDLEKTKGGAGAPIHSESGKIRTRMPITMKKNDYGEGIIREVLHNKRPPRVQDDDEEHQVYDPFGKPGGGGPLRDSQGNVKTTTTGNFNDRETYIKRPDPRKKFISDDLAYESQNYIDMTKQIRQQEDRELKFGGGEFATEMSKLHTGRPRVDPVTGYIANNHLGSSDVTREKVNAREPYQAGRPKVKEYHSELEKAAEYRERRKHLDRRKEQQEARKHADSMDDFWGRPGGGAPKGDDNRKMDLDYTIYSSRKESSERRREDRFYDEYRPSKSEPAEGAGHKDYLQKRHSNESPRVNDYNNSSYIKNTSGSSAYNGYQVEPISRKQQYEANNRDLWNRPAPYASYGSYND